MKILVVSSLLLLSLPSASQAEGTSFEVRSGVTAFFQGQSLALAHRLKPTARMEFSWDAKDKIRLGIEALSVIDALEEYRILGGLFVVHVPALRSGGFTLEWKSGWGMGTTPDILFRGLRSTQPIGLLTQMGFAFRWEITPTVHWSLHLHEENLSTLGLEAGLAF